MQRSTVHYLEVMGTDSCWWSTENMASTVSVSSGKRLNKTQLESWQLAHNASLSQRLDHCHVILSLCRDGRSNHMVSLSRPSIFPFSLLMQPLLVYFKLLGDIF